MKSMNGLRAILVVSFYLIGCEANAETVKWLNVSEQSCTNGGGIMIENTCQTSLKNSIKICSSLGADIPYINELRKVVTTCGGSLDDHMKNDKNSNYKKCYKNNGFKDGGYWSIFFDRYSNRNSRVIHFYDGSEMDGNLITHAFVRCVTNNK